MDEKEAHFPFHRYKLDLDRRFNLGVLLRPVVDTLGDADVCV